MSVEQQERVHAKTLQYQDIFLSLCPTNLIKCTRFRWNFLRVYFVCSGVWTHSHDDRQITYMWVHWDSLHPATRVYLSGEAYRCHSCREHLLSRSWNLKLYTRTGTQKTRDMFLRATLRNSHPTSTAFVSIYTYIFVALAGKCLFQPHDNE